MNLWQRLKQLFRLTAVLGAAGSRITVMAGTFSELPFDAASKEAGKSDKIVLVDFYTTWCGPCKMLDKNTWTDEGVKKLLAEKTVALRVDAEKETALAQKYKIDGYPTILLLKPDGSEIDRLVGYRDPKMFTTEFNDALAGRDGVARARAKAAQSGTNDPSARMQLGVALAQKGKDAEALTEYAWCFEHGAEASPAFVGVRLSFLLNYIKSLAAKYPPARRQLETWRDERQAGIATNPASAQKVSELIALNNALDDEAKNLALFDKLPADNRAKDVVRQMLADQLLKEKRYADVLPGGGAKATFDQQVEKFATMVKSLPKDSPSKSQMQTSLNQYLVRQGTKYFEALAGLKRDQEAKDLAADILKLDSSPETRAALANAAQQVENTELAKYVKE